MTIDTIRERHRECGDSAGGCVVYVDNDTGDLVPCDTSVVLDALEAQERATQACIDILPEKNDAAHAKALAEALREMQREAVVLSEKWRPLGDPTYDPLRHKPSLAMRMLEADEALAAYDKDHER